MLYQYQIADLLQLGMFETVWIRELKFKATPHYADLNGWVLAISHYW